MPDMQASVPVKERSADDYRFERKYHIQDLNLHEVEMWVRRSPCLFRECFPPRYINNIYFDTPELDNYHENLGGQAARTKLRLRWYGDYLYNPSKTTLEYKIKQGMVGTKESYKLPALSLKPGFGYDGLKTYWDSCPLPDRVKEDAAVVLPTIGNRYRRKYFLSMDGDYRITIDSELSFIAIERFDNSFERIRKLHQSVIVELKYQGSIATLDERLMNFFPFRITRMSKYVSGVELLHG